MKKKMTLIATKAKNTRPSRAEAERAVRTLIEWAGENPNREGLRDTPQRVVRSFEEYFSGYVLSAADVLSRTFTEVGGYDGPVLIKDLSLESRCEHHLAPFVGRVHIAYIPNGRVVGLSKVARVVNVYASRMQTQERLTSEISDALNKHLKPQGVAVLMEAEHFCMKVRGVHEDHALTVTTCFLGLYKKDAELREEFLRLVRE
ncbi:MAG: GTP cyclohydrolase I FolE [Proteobacteria bacterium]|nr:GTP cyclohydrolase I FolE [Pseudomonadota bacterium]